MSIKVKFSSRQATEETHGIVDQQPRASFQRSPQWRPRVFFICAATANRQHSSHTHSTAHSVSDSQCSEPHSWQSQCVAVDERSSLSSVLVSDICDFVCDFGNLLFRKTRFRKMSAAATPAVTVPAKVTKKKTSSKPKKVATHPTYSEMIKSALTNLKVLVCLFLTLCNFDCTALLRKGGISVV